MAIGAYSHGTSAAPTAACTAGGAQARSGLDVLFCMVAQIKGSCTYHHNLAAAHWPLSCCRSCPNLIWHPCRCRRCALAPRQAWSRQQLAIGHLRSTFLTCWRLEKGPQPAPRANPPRGKSALPVRVSGRACSLPSQYRGHGEPVKLAAGRVCRRQQLPPPLPLPHPPPSYTLSHPLLACERSRLPSHPCLPHICPLHPDSCSPKHPGPAAV